MGTTHEFQLSNLAHAHLVSMFGPLHCERCGSELHVGERVVSKHTCGHPRRGVCRTMSEREAKKCPKCEGEMAPGEPITGWDVLGFDVAYLPLRLKKSGDTVDSNIHAFYCKNCGYVEFYAKK